MCIVLCGVLRNSPLLFCLMSSFINENVAFVTQKWSEHHVLFFSSQGTPARWRDFHSATIIGTKMFVFGGRADRFGPFHSNNEIYCNKIKVFDTETNCWLSTPSTQPLPEGRRSHSACTTQTNNILRLFMHKKLRQYCHQSLKCCIMMIFISTAVCQTSVIPQSVQ